MKKIKIVKYNLKYEKNSQKKILSFTSISFVIICMLRILVIRNFVWRRYYKLKGIVGKLLISI